MKTYNVKRIDDKSEITDCNVLKLLHQGWVRTKPPYTYGYLGILKDTGLYLEMVCEETDPLRNCTEYNDMVYLDSAMEAFFCFSPDIPGTSYLNFEFNANGALRTQFGPSRTEREFVAPELIELCSIKTEIREKSWKASLLIPLTFLQHFFPNVTLCAGETFLCNFYKLSETPEYEHYAMFAPVESPTPNFHMPEFFATAVIQ